MDPHEMSVDELARAAGTLSSTVRLYQNRGLLPPPRRQGRRAVYGAHHLDRLRLIAELQERGHSLAGIRELVDKWDTGKGLPDVLGIDELSSPEPLRLSITELVARFAGAEIAPHDLVRAGELGLVEVDGADVVVTDQRFLDLGVTLVRLGLPVAVLLDEWAVLSTLTDQVADRFSAVLNAHLWVPTAAPSPDELDRIVGLLGELAGLARQVTVMALDASLRRAAERTAAELGVTPV